ncbi:MAG TPA: GTP-binding protein [Desulfobacteraceae bacterium]|nr:GTP-binding protein [Desulfobacteraceae bacterium]|tara:strand:+ start:863 stop:1360 length:498 start_codon:yes stop_codon:yes gene_type:complete
MTKKKICLLGAFAVGKTSLVQQYVNSIFSDKYHTTVGVKIEKTSVDVDGEAVDLIIWDLHGEDDFQHVRLSYLKGSAGLIFVADGTRHSTLATALNLRQIAESSMGSLPFMLLVNKADLADQWEIDDEVMEDLRGQGISVIPTSAKTGQSVEWAFEELARKMVGK